VCVISSRVIQNAVYMWGSVTTDTRERPITVLTFTNFNETQITLTALRGTMRQLPDFDLHGGCGRATASPLLHGVYRSQEAMTRKI